MKNNYKSLSLLFGLVLFYGCSFVPVAGQGEKEGAVSGQAERDRGGIKGVWRTVVTPRICATGAPVGPTFPGILMFNQDGTLAGTSTAAASVYGLWRREAGHREFSFATISFRYDSAGILVGSRRISQDVSLDNSGDAFTTTGSFQDYDNAGNPVASGCSTATGVRFE